MNMKNEMLHKKREFASVRELVEWAGKKYGAQTAYSFKRDPRKSEVTKVSFAELRDDVRALASAMLEMGCKGRHVALVGKLSYEWALVYFSALSIGAVLVPLDREWTGSDLADTVSRADCEFLFCDGDIAEKASAVSESVTLASAPVSISEGGGLDALLSRGRELFERNKRAYFETRLRPNELALLVFTSGTTGKGKGVMLSQTAILSDLADVIPYIDFGKKTVGVLPPHHTYGSSVMLIGHTMIGCEVYISAGLRYVTKELREQKPEHLVLVPLYLETFYRRIMANVKEQKKEKLVRGMMKTSNALTHVGIDLRKKLFKTVREAFGGNIKMIISGGAPINPEILDFFEGLGISTLNGYGITECAPIVAVNRSKNPVKGSVGNVLDLNHVRIKEKNEDGEGEICVKGANVMLGYYKDEAATEEAFDENGYFRTGDYGKMKDGILYITGRKKNLIILSNGKNVYPEEIENELIAVPGVLDVIVYEGQSKRGVMHNAIVAEIYPDKDYCTKNGVSDIYAHLKSYIDTYNKTAISYKKIGVLKVRDEEFPKNTLRKIMRLKLHMTID